jgi:transposase
VCVQPLLVGRAREAEDYTRDKSDDKDEVLIARLVAQLSCYAPERADATWAHLRQLGARREELITQATRCVQQLRDLLECAWPAALTAAAEPFDSTNWCAALAVVLDRCDGDPRGGWPDSARNGLPPRCAVSCRAGAVNGCGGASWARCSPRCPIRPGASRRSAPGGCWATRLADVETRMIEVLDELGYTELLTSIPGISAVAAATKAAQDRGLSNATFVQDDITSFTGFDDNR